MRPSGRAAVAAAVLVVGVALVAIVVWSHRGGSSAAPPKVPQTRKGPVGEGPAPAHPATPITGWVHTAGDQIVDASGAPLRMLGADEPGLIAGQGGSRTGDPDSCGEGWQPIATSEFDRFHHWGFNTVRLGVSWANLEPTPPTTAADGTLVHHWNKPYLAALDQAVEGFSRAGVGVILDLHQNHMSPAFRSPRPGICEGAGLPTWLYPDAASLSARDALCHFFQGVSEPGSPEPVVQGYGDVWKFLAGRYASNKMVIGADIFNEPSPGRCPGMDANPVYHRLGSAIRSANPHLLLIYQDSPGRKDVYAVQGPLGLPNAVYSFHLYTDTWTDAESRVAAHLARARQFGEPMWIGEFGTIRGGAAPFPGTADMLAYFGQNGISWAYHEYSAGQGSLVSSHTGQINMPMLRLLEGGLVGAPA